MLDPIAALPQRTDGALQRPYEDHFGQEPIKLCFFVEWDILTIVIACGDGIGEEQELVSSGLFLVHPLFSSSLHKATSNNFSDRPSPL